MQESILRYFPDLTSVQSEKLMRLEHIYSRWNSMINVISRKDMENFMIHHVLHSLAIARIFSFREAVRILDVGTGGGFPGIPLAIAFPSARFFLLDSVGKKIKVVSAVVEELGLENVTPLNKRVEDEKESYDFITGRAVTEFSRFVNLTKKNIRRTVKDNQESGIICLKGGDLSDEMGKYQSEVRIWNISEFFEEDFFETKKIIYLPF